MDGRNCPFCSKAFRCLGKHLQHCPQRNGKPYQPYLANKQGKKTRTNSDLLTPCPVCEKNFKHLDVHLRWNSQCRDPLSADKSSLVVKLQQKHSELLVDVTQTTVSQNQPKTSQSISSIRPIPSQPHTIETSQPLPSQALPSEPQSPPLLTPSYHIEPPSIGSKAPLRVPRISDQDAWLLGDEFVHNVLFPQVMKERQLEDKVKLFSDGLYDFFGENFGYTQSPEVNKAISKT